MSNERDSLREVIANQKAIMEALSYLMRHLNPPGWGAHVVNFEARLERTKQLLDSGGVSSGN
jgi:hypothetical protein